MTTFPAAVHHVALAVTELDVSRPWRLGAGLSFRDPDDIALEFWAPRTSDEAAR